MYHLPKTSTVVMVGNWNTAILTPPWLGKRLFEDERLTVTVTLGAGEPETRLAGQDAEIAATAHKVTIYALDSLDESLARIEGMALSLLDTLPYTPIAAVGINFAMVETAPSSDLLRYLACEDDPLLAEDRQVRSHTIKRAYEWDDCTVNVAMSRKPDPADVRFDFNFHYEPREDATFLQRLEAGVVQADHEHALGVLTRYGLEMEAPPSDEEA